MATPLRAKLIITSSPPDVLFLQANCLIVSEKVSKARQVAEFCYSYALENRSNPFAQTIALYRHGLQVRTNHGNTAKRG